MNSSDLLTIYDFIKATGEGNIKKMMTGPKMTGAHVTLLLKITRSSTPDDFVKYCESNSFPRIKLTREEEKVKEGFWNVALDTFVQLGFATSKAA